MNIVNIKMITFAYRSHWSKSWPFNSFNFSAIMSSRRFELLMRFLHLSDSSTMPPRSSPLYDRQYKIRPIIDILIKNFKGLYTPRERKSVDESMIGFKGRLSWVQYIPKKPTKWGLKAWVLADSSNGYVWNWRLYTRKEEGHARDGKGLGHCVVLDLVNDLAGKGYFLFVDNYYTSPALFTDLIHLGFSACGTEKMNRKGLSTTFKNVDLEKGGVYSELTEDGSMLCLKWRDKRCVSMLSTTTALPSRDVAHRMCQVVLRSLRNPESWKSTSQWGVWTGQIRWSSTTDSLIDRWKRAFFHLLDLSIVNASILYNEVHPHHQLTQLEFRTEVTKGLLEGYPLITRQQSSSSVMLPLRLTERPFPERIPSDSRYGGRPQCEVCRKRKVKRSQTQYRCKTCKTTLHIDSFFEIYHSRLHY